MNRLSLSKYAPRNGNGNSSRARQRAFTTISASRATIGMHSVHPVACRQHHRLHESSRHRCAAMGYEVHRNPTWRGVAPTFGSAHCVAMRSQTRPGVDVHCFLPDAHRQAGGRSWRRSPKAASPGLSHPTSPAHAAARQTAGQRSTAGAASSKPGQQPPELGQRVAHLGAIPMAFGSRPSRIIECCSSSCGAPHPDTSGLHVCNDGPLLQQTRPECATAPKVSHHHTACSPLPEAQSVRHVDPPCHLAAS